MIFVDTSFLLAVLNPRDALHSRAQALAEVITEPLLVTEYVIWELVNALSMPADRAKVHAAIQEIQTAPEWEWIPASPDLFSAGMQLHGERPDKAWSLTDCISFLTMQQRHIHRAGSSTVLVEPGVICTTLVTCIFIDALLELKVTQDQGVNFDDRD